MYVPVIASALYAIDATSSKKKITKAPRVDFRAGIDVRARGLVFVRENARELEPQARRGEELPLRRAAR